MGSIDDGDNSKLPTTGEPIPFGHAMRPYFLFDDKWVNLNHGSFGAYPTPVRNAKRGYTKLMEAAPDKFLRYQYQDLQLKARERVAALLKVPVTECVFVPNATHGLNTILRNLTYKEKDVIIYFDTIYGAIEKTLASIVETIPQLGLKKVGYGQENAYVLPTSHSEICTVFSQTISRLLYEGYNIRAAVFDTISSLPGARIPFERLTKICKEYGILSIIDGAHSVGQIPLNLAQLDPDFFVSNCHKWLFTPRGCAVLRVPQRNQHLIRTSYPTSHGYLPVAQGGFRNPLPPTTLTPFENLFQFVATTDNTPYYCVPAAMNFRQNLCGGEEAIYEYIKDIAQRGADLLATKFGTVVMDDFEPTEEGNTGSKQAPRKFVGGLRDCALATVLLPIVVDGAQRNAAKSGAASSNGEQSASPEHNGGEASDLAAKDSGMSKVVDALRVKQDDVPRVVAWMQQTMVDEYHTFVPIFEYQGQMWTRLSGQIYLELSDFEWLAGTLQRLLQRVAAGEASTANLTKKAGAISSDQDPSVEKLGQGVASVSV